MRFFVLVIASLLSLLGLLTLVKAPTLIGWKLALLAGEFGYILALIAVVLLLTQLRGACGGPGDHVGFSRACVMMSMLAALLLAAPPLRAWWIARRLPQHWEASFGQATRETFFRWGDLLRIRASATVVKVTYSVPSAAGAQALDFYPAQNLSSPLAPCIVVVHGGGWNNGDRTQLAALNSWLATRGFSVAAIDYRLVPAAQWPAPREDTEAALRWLQAHATELHLATDQFVLLGRSAGGQIALATAYGSTKASWRGVISLYGPADLNFAYRFGDENDVLHSLALMRALLGGTPEQVSSQYNDASPYSYVSSDDPPTLLIHGQLDTLVWHKQSERLDHQLTRAGVPHLFISLPWATHAFDINPNGPGGQLTRHAVEAFIRTVLSKEPRSPSHEK